LLFHVLTGIDARSPTRREARFHALLSCGGCLTPTIDRGGGRSDGLMNGYEAGDASGDNRYIFLTVGRPFQWLPDVGSQPAVAFRFEALLIDRPRTSAQLTMCNHGESRVGWRPHDLMFAYEAAARTSEEEHGDGADPGFYLGKALAGLAERWTFFDRRQVEALLRLEAQALRTPDPDPDIGRKVLVVLGLDGKALRAARRAGVDPVRAFRADGTWRPWPDTLSTESVTEVVYEGSLPLRAAVAWRDAHGEWHPGPDDLAAPCAGDDR
jgi:hypothetical protein